MSESAASIPVSVRYNPFKPCEKFIGKSLAWNDNAIILNSRPSFTLDPLFHAGCYYVQDSSAMFVGHILRKCLSEFFPNAQRIKVLDLCAAPGGKATDAASSLRLKYGSDFQLVSNEVMKNRASLLCDNVSVWGDPNVVVTSLDPAAFATVPGYFDIIIADVPCSGEGMFRKDVKAQKMWSEDLVNLCSLRQRRILADVWSSLKTGGILIYSTCTYQQAENDDNLLWAAKELGGEIIKFENEFSQFGVELTLCGSLLRAGVVPGEGQWVGALVKTTAQKEGSEGNFLKLKTLKNGINRGEFKGKDFIPNSDWALSIDFDMSIYPQIELDCKSALKYLHRDTLVFSDAAMGYNVITYLGHPLGFVKNIGSRCNNLLPKGRRILMQI